MTATGTPQTPLARQLGVLMDAMAAGLWEEAGEIAADIPTLTGTSEEIARARALVRQCEAALGLRQDALIAEMVALGDAVDAADPRGAIVDVQA